MVSKKIIHFFLKYYKKRCFLKLGIFKYLLSLQTQILCLDNNLTNRWVLQQPPINYLNFFNLKLSIKTKSLFLFTMYILFSKLPNLFNGYNFQFHISLKKQKKITILRAPCNHKNSKEQYGVFIFVGKLKGYFPFFQNLIYHKYLLCFFQTQHCTQLFNFNYFLLSKNAYKFIN